MAVMRKHSGIAFVKKHPDIKTFKLFFCTASVKCHRYFCRENLLILLNKTQALMGAVIKLPELKSGTIKQHFPGGSGFRGIYPHTIFFE